MTEHDPGGLDLFGHPGGADGDAGHGHGATPPEPASGHPGGWDAPAWPHGSDIGSLFAPPGGSHLPPGADQPATEHSGDPLPARGAEHWGAGEHGAEVRLPAAWSVFHVPAPAAEWSLPVPDWTSPEAPVTNVDPWAPGAHPGTEGHGGFHWGAPIADPSLPAPVDLAPGSIPPFLDPAGGHWPATGVPHRPDAPTTPLPDDPVWHDLPQPSHGWDPFSLVVPEPPPAWHGLHGDPDRAAGVWIEQSRDGYCAPTSAAEVINWFTGAHVTEDEIVGAASRLHLFEPGGGMSAQDAATLLTDCGVPSHVEVGTLEDLRLMLDQGHGIVLAIDAHDVWHDQPDDPRGGANHAVMLTGIDDRTGVVYLDDPGTPGGREEAVPLADLERAWSDGGHRMVVTDGVAPGAERSSVLLPVTLHWPPAPAGPQP